MNLKTSLLLLAVFGASLPSVSIAADTAKHFTLDDLSRLVSLSEPQISPDGKSIAFVVRRVEAGTNKWEHELDLVDIQSGKCRALTHGRKEVSFPRWSPSGDRLAFLANDGNGKDALTQIFVLPMNGGDALQVTKSPTDVQHFAWRPDGNDIAFAAADEPPNKKAIENGDDAFEVGDDNLFTKDEAVPVHIWLVPAEGGKARRLTSGSWSLSWVLPPSPPASPLSWSPDGSRIAFVRQATAHTGDSDQSTVQILDVSTGTIKPFTSKSLFESFPTFSPDGSKLVYWAYRDRDPNNVNELFVAPASGGVGDDISIGLDRCVLQSIWMPDGKSILTGGHDGTGVSLWQLPLGGQPRRLDLGGLNPKWGYWVEVTVGNNGSIAFVANAPNHPDELYFMDSPTGTVRKLTDFNSAIAARNLGRVESLQWQGPDGFAEDGTLTYPPDYKAETKLPLVLYIHGGPNAASTLNFTPLPQLLAARGYLVFSPNYRGSDNLGNAYQRAIFNDAGDGPGRDVMSGLKAVEEKGIVDESRIAVTGWSYGGYMTSWMIGHHTFWKAAVAGAAVTDLRDGYYFADFNVQQRYLFPGHAVPWTAEGSELYAEQSPITYATNVTTPTLIMCTTGDFRVPPTQSYKLYHVLKGRGVPTEMVAYPVTGHFPGDLVRTRDIYRRWLDWMDKYMGSKDTSAN